jgi:hypothetical protein
MALRDKSLFLYNYQITVLNNSIDFRVVAAEPIRLATLNLGFYSLTSLLAEIVRAMTAVAPTFIFTATADRTFMGGLENRVTIATTAAHFELLFGTGPRNTSTVAPLIGFASVDQLGFTSYTGTSTSGTVLTTDWWGSKYQGPETYQNIFGAVNISASGQKEAIVFQIMQFIQVQFMYEPASKVVGFGSQWFNFWQWTIQQRQFEFTPEIFNPTTFYPVTLESTSGDGKGLGFKMTEQVPTYPFLFDTGLLKFRVVL